MKIRFTLILFFNLLAILTVYSQTRVTINLRSADFKKVISTIEHQSIYHFVYSERKIPALNKVDINVDNEDVKTVLDKILANSGFAYTELANHLIVIAPVDEIVNVVKVTGIVVDENGAPLAGATVRVRGSTMGASTDLQGAFSFEAPDQSTLIISFVGYVTRDVKLSGTNPLKISLTISNVLSEVVVTALGIKRKREK
jgi:multidrug efflux pump subunit AcrA (membrane-fusion protein)